MLAGKSCTLLFLFVVTLARTVGFEILGVYFDRKLTWGHMIDQLTVRCRQRLGALFRVREYLGQGGLAVAYKSFVRLVCEYGCVIFMGASAVHLHKLDAVQKAAGRLCQISFQPLSSRCCASCWTLVVNSHSRIFPPPLSLSHILVVCDISVMILCCCGALSSITHWIYL